MTLTDREKIIIMADVIKDYQRKFHLNREMSIMSMQIMGKLAIPNFVFTDSLFKEVVDFETELNKILSDFIHNTSKEERSKFFSEQKTELLR